MEMLFEDHVAFFNHAKWMASVIVGQSMLQ